MTHETEKSVAKHILESINGQWFFEMHENMVYVAVAQALKAHEYTYVANMLRDLADLIEDNGRSEEE